MLLPSRQLGNIINTSRKRTASVGIVGRIPPPYGGVSVHLIRTLHRLKAEGIPYIFYDLGGRYDASLSIVPAVPGPSLFTTLKKTDHVVYHFHMSNPNGVLLAWFLSLSYKKRICYSLHGEGIINTYEGANAVLRYALRRSLQTADFIFPINRDGVASLMKMGVPEERISWMAAYVPPSSDDLDFVLPSNLQTFLDEHHPVLVSQGSFGAFTGKKHIYRFDLLAHAMVALRETYPQIGLCTMISNNLNSKHREEIMGLRDSLGLTLAWYIYEGDPMPAACVYKQCDIFVRPTETDGDSVSIRECLAMGVPVVASDAVVRPEMCSLFATGSVAGCIAAITEQLADYEAACQPLKSMAQPDYLLELIAYYRAKLA